jgi:hypothetical protein
MQPQTDAALSGCWLCACAAAAVVNSVVCLEPGASELAT